MRQSNKSKQWYDWLVRVEGSGQQDDGSIEVSLQAFIDPKLAEDAYCLGFMSTFYDSPGYGSMCSLPPYGTGMFMNGSVSCPAGQDTDAQKWFIRPVGDSGEIEILAPKPSVCARAVAVKDCEYQPILVNYPVVNEASTNIYAKWKLVKRYALVPRTSPPSPVPSPPAPLGPIPGPIISAPTSTSSAYVNVVVNFLGGNSRCQVKSIEITAVGASVGAVPTTVEVSASTPALNTAGVPILLPYSGYNSVYAYSICSSGEKTVISNTLTVFYLKGSPAPQVPTGVFFVLKYSSPCVTACNSTDVSRICDNVVALQSGGRCSLVEGIQALQIEPPFISGSSEPFSYFAVGSVSYQTGQDAASLVQKLVANPSSLLTGPWGSCGVDFNAEITTIAVADPLPNPPIIPNPPTPTSAAFQNNCTQIKIDFTPPADTTGIVAYGAGCQPQALRRRLMIANADVFGSTQGADSTSILLEKPANRYYTCIIVSFTVDGTQSVLSDPVDANYSCGTPPA